MRALMTIGCILAERKWDASGYPNALTVNKRFQIHKYLNSNASSVLVILDRISEMRFSALPAELWRATLSWIPHRPRSESQTLKYISLHISNYYVKYDIKYFLNIFEHEKKHNLVSMVAIWYTLNVDFINEKNV